MTCGEQGGGCSCRIGRQRRREFCEERKGGAWDKVDEVEEVGGRE